MITYDITLNFTIKAEESEIGKLKSPLELAQDIAHMVCDECVNSGGVAIYSIQEAKYE